ncbi:LOW QUALITY PROTEIN: hypothetical protein CFOL_v3_16391 [Cephalotus follicularis]|uniref:Lipase_GDSL domain-containing protein n=1 Tax=Cephalotus follicularis TaxID=3775 RepID=A0A1Q3BYR5_CEPFO|nr:LOW QUALITY PROTEIN: hypothetical protein CFOL_v3_16391 [Cephalotus follicularis]
MNQTENYNETNYWSAKYNEGLKTMMQGLKSEFKSIPYPYFYTYNIMQNMIKKPVSYGYTEVKSACCAWKLKSMFPCVPIATYCSNRGDHVLWDPCHPAEASLRNFADTTFDDPIEYKFPMNVRQLVAV